MTGLSIPSIEKGGIFHFEVENNNNIFQVTTPKIINLSDFDLTPGMISLLTKGLNFCPTPFSSDLLELEGNLREFVRLLLLKDNFGHINNNSTPEYLVRRTGQTIPSESKDMLLNGVIFNIIKLSEKLDALPTNHAAAKSNITMEERQALKLLRDNNDIVIKQVDKGGGYYYYYGYP